MRYILRCVVHEPFWQRQLDDLVSVCHAGGIEEVLLMEQSHQIIMSPYPLEKHRRMAGIYSYMAEKLRAEGIGYSVNIASIIGHADTVPPNEYGLPFTRFVSSTLRPNHSTFCILDEDWVAYASEVASLYASTSPDLLMIDDDFRSLNHTEFLGCFCPLHVKRTNEKLGISLDAEGLRDAVLHPEIYGHDIRKAWMDINFQGQLKAAEEIGKAARNACPSVKVGLMNSGEPQHSVQGRHMQELICAFSGKDTGYSRPLGGAYSDSVHSELADAYLGMALSAEQIIGSYIISEVENWPHTLFTKSLKSTELQMKLHTLAGADAISLNIFDYLATPYSQEPEFTSLLSSVKEELGHIEKSIKDMHSNGLGLLWKGNEAERTVNGILPARGMDGLSAQMGISVMFREGRVNLLYGETAAVLDDDEISRLLSKGLIVSSEAIDVLLARGFGEYLGIETQGRIDSAGVERIIPHPLSGGFAGNMLSTNEFRFITRGITIPRYSAIDDSEVISVFEDIEYRRISDGMVMHKNSLGGNVLLLPVPFSTWSYAFRSRASILKEFIKLCDPDTICLSSLNIFPIHLKAQDNRSILALLNTGLDEEATDLPFPCRNIRTDIIDSGRVVLSPLELRIYEAFRYQ